MAEQHSPMEMLGDITVDTDDSYDLGAPTFRFQDLYLSGTVSDGTGTATIQDVVYAKRFSFFIS